MKKLVLLLVAGLSFSFAQVAQAQRIGLKAGVNYSNLAGDLSSEAQNENKLGFVGGIGTSIPLMADGFLSIAPELLYSQKGYKYRDDEFKVGNNTMKYTGKVDFSYLDVPVLLKVNASGLIFEGGPVGSYLLSVKDRSEVMTNNTKTNNVNKINREDLGKFEIGYAAGVGYMTPGGFSLNLRYNGNISKLANNNDGGDLRNTRHSLFQFTTGYLLGSK